MALGKKSKKYLRDINKMEKITQKEEKVKNWERTGDKKSSFFIKKKINELTKIMEEELKKNVTEFDNETETTLDIRNTAHNSDDGGVICFTINNNSR